jgi:hypothetical protein
MSIKEEKEKLKLKLKELEEFEKELFERNTYKLTTNTAFLQNSKVTEIFDMWKGFKDFIIEKHERHWKGENSSEVEITFKVLNNKKAIKIAEER